MSGDLDTYGMSDKPPTPLSYQGPRSPEDRPRFALHWGTPALLALLALFITLGWWMDHLHLSVPMSRSSSHTPVLPEGQFQVQAVAPPTGK